MRIKLRFKNDCEPGPWSIFAVVYVFSQTLGTLRKFHSDMFGPHNLATVLDCI